MPGTGTCTNLEKLQDVTLTPTTAGPNPQPAPVDGGLTVEVTSGDGSFEQTGGPLQFTPISGTALGDTVYTVSVDADLDATGVRTISDTYTLTVTSPQAENLSFSGGTAVPK